MRTGIAFTVDAADRARLEAIVADRNRPQKHVWRARIILLTSAGVGTSGIERETGKDKTCVWRWQERFMLEGIDGLLRDKTRPSRKPPLATSVIERVVTLTKSDPPSEATHWTAAAMAKAVGVSISSVQRIWRAHGLQARAGVGAGVGHLVGGGGTAAFLRAAAGELRADGPEGPHAFADTGRPGGDVP